MGMMPLFLTAHVNSSLLHVTVGSRCLLQCCPRQKSLQPPIPVDPFLVGRPPSEALMLCNILHTPPRTKLGGVTLYAGTQELHCMAETRACGKR
ncbi:hypothetical protein VUR80DRAFT_7433 [Thermomyces stellatus]